MISKGKGQFSLNLKRSSLLRAEQGAEQLAAPRLKIPSPDADCKPPAQEDGNTPVPVRIMKKFGSLYSVQTP